MSLMDKEMYEFGPFSLDPAERVISRDGTPLSMTPKVFDTLVCLVRNQGRLLTKDELLKEVWPDTFVEESNLAQQIFVLRKTLGDAVDEKRYIVTVPGRGYRFTEVVRAVAVKEDQDQEIEGTEEEQIVLASQNGAPACIAPSIRNAGSITNSPCAKLMVCEVCHNSVNPTATSA